VKGHWSEYDQAVLQQKYATSIIGRPKTAKEKLETFTKETQADEIIINAAIYNHNARLHSFKLVADIIKNH
jgi:alkanesulfonate monooxygenase SsuD/methylene tetrahydromethanopterin reductase-like flavin-dependent oxidoreductase (luciferase family)